MRSESGHNELVPTGIGRLSISNQAMRKSKDIIVVEGESWNSVMTTPNAPNSKPANRSSHKDAYLLGELIGGVVEEIDRQMTLDDDVTDLRDSLDRLSKDRLQWEKEKSDTYESRSREIDRKWKRY